MAAAPDDAEVLALVEASPPDRQDPALWHYDQAPEGEGEGPGCQNQRPDHGDRAPERTDDYPSRPRATLTWLDPGQLITLAVEGRLVPPGWNLTDPAMAVWLATEAHDVTAIRHALHAAGLPQGTLAASGYWCRTTPISSALWP
jgi:hypothetical protein